MGEVVTFDLLFIWRLCMNKPVAESGKGAAQGAVGVVQTAVAKSGEGVAQSAVQGAVGVVQTAVAKSGKGAAQSAVQGAVQGAVQTAVAKFGKGTVQGAAQGAVQTAMAKSGKDASRSCRCCAGCSSKVLWRVVQTAVQSLVKVWDEVVPMALRSTLKMQSDPESNSSVNTSFQHIAIGIAIRVDVQNVQVRTPTLKAR
eukprot:s2808_g8.t1